MLVRLCMLVLLAVAMATQGTTLAGAGPDDLQAELAELAELDCQDAILVRGLELDAPMASPAPPLVRGTEVVHTSPPSGRVFRPPRAAFG